MDIYELLKNDHRLVEELLDNLADGEQLDRELFQTMRDNLLVHAHAEDEVVYATLARKPECASLIEESRQDHSAIEGLLEEIGSGTLDGDWQDKLDDLEALIAEHVEFEETELIPMAQRLLDESTETQLAERFTARKEELAAAKS